MSDDLTRAAELNEQGQQAYGRGDYAAARDAFECSLAIRRGVLGEDHPHVVPSLNNLGVVSYSLGDYAAARDYYEQALTIDRRVLGEEHPDVAALLNNLGIVARDLGDSVTAVRFHHQALEIRRRALGEEHPSVAASLNNLGAVETALGNLSAARGFYEQALAIRRRTLGEGHRDVAASLNNLGAVAYELGDYAAARDFFEQVLAIRRPLLGEGHPEVATCLTNLGMVVADLGDHAAARDYNEKALAILRPVLGEAHPYVGKILSNLGVAAYETGDLAMARLFFEQAREITRRALGANHMDAGSCLVRLGCTLSGLGDRDGARTALGEALCIARLPDNAALLPQACHALSELCVAQGAAAAAIFLGKQAVNALQRQRGGLTELERELQRAFLTSKEEPYRHLAGLLVDAGRLAEAQRVLAMLKEEELFDLLRRDAAGDPRLTLAALTGLEAAWRRRGDDLAAAITALTAEEAALRARGAERSPGEETRLAELGEELDAAQRRFGAWLDDLLADSAADAPERQRELAALNLAALEGWQADLADLGPGTMMLHYLVRPDRLAIIVTAPSFQIGRDVAVGERALNRAVHEFRLAVEKRTDDVLPLARTLYGWLIAPIAPQLAEAGARTLAVALDGVLRYLPLAALHDGERFLIERHPLALLTPAAQGRLKDRPSTAWRVAGLGVAREVPGYARLPAVAEELRGIVREGAAGDGVFPGTILLDAAFTEAALAEALPTHHVVHLASHFVLVPGDELASHLLLGDGGALTLDRLRERRFRFGGVELVALSACETALGGGRGADGREVEGLGALVQNRGAKAVLATLWPVADVSTAPLMRCFYAGRAAGLTKAEALRQAQLQLLRGGGVQAEPHHWAPYVLMGNWL